MYIHMKINVKQSVNVHIHAHVHVYVSVFVCVYVCVNVCTRLRKCKGKYVNVISHICKLNSMKFARVCKSI